MDGPISRKEKKSKSRKKHSKGSSSKNSRHQAAKHLPPLFLLIERSEWRKVAERARNHPREVSTWANVRKSSGGETPTLASSFSADSPRLSESGPANSQDGGSGPITPVASGNKRKVSTVKCKALHHACHRLRSVRYHRSASGSSGNELAEVSTPRMSSRSFDAEDADSTRNEDEYVEACKAILALIEAHPEAASQRESRHGCLPLHLAAFGMCSSPPTPPPPPLPKPGGSPSGLENSHKVVECEKGDKSTPSASSSSSPPPCVLGRGRPGGGLPPISVRDESPPPPPPPPGVRTGRSSSHSSADMSLGGISAMIESELASGGCPGAGVYNRTESDVHDSSGTFSPFCDSANDSNPLQDEKKSTESPAEDVSCKPPVVTRSRSTAKAASISPKGRGSVGSKGVASGSSAPRLVPRFSTAGLSSAERSVANLSFHPNGNTPRRKVDVVKREDYSLRVINALLDAYPKGARVDSEGGRLPLHTACAGQASTVVVRTLLRAYPDAARHRNKEGYLPLHLAAHWGVSHPDVAPALLKFYPDATVGRNRWERTPLEEALAMAGENGRPHQVALVRALRRHPSYWTRPFNMEASLASVLHPGGDIGLDGNKPIKKESPKNLVDVDETIPDDESSDEENKNADECHPTGNDEPGAPLPPGHDDEEGGVEETQGRFINRISPRNIIRKGYNPADLRKKSNNRRRQAAPASPSTASSGGLGGRPILAPSGTAGQSSICITSSPTDLPTMIKLGSWEGILARCESDPADFAEIVSATVRGGYPARVTPLYLVAERNPPLDVVETLVEIHRDAVSRRKNPGGQLPLHAACTWGASSGVIAYLLAANPSAARNPDDLSNLPLHCACYSGADEEIIEALLCTYPRSVWVRNSHGSSPSDVVRRLRHPNRTAVLELLELRARELLGKKSGGSGGVANSSSLSSGASFGFDDDIDEGVRENGDDHIEESPFKIGIPKEPSPFGDDVEVQIDDAVDNDQTEDADDGGSEDSDGMLWI